MRADARSRGDALPLLHNVTKSRGHVAAGKLSKPHHIALFSLGALRRVACAGNGGRSRACDQLTEAGNLTRVLSAELQVARRTLAVDDGRHFAAPGSFIIGRRWAQLRHCGGA